MSEYRKLLDYYCGTTLWFDEISLSQQDEISLAYFDDQSSKDKYEIICSYLEPDFVDFLENILSIIKNLNHSEIDHKELIISCLTEPQLNRIISKITYSCVDFFNDYLNDQRTFGGEKDE